MAMDKKLRTTVILSWLIAIFYLLPAPLLSIILNAIHYITRPGLRAGNPLISPEHLVTLVVGLLFAVCLVYLKRGSYRARLTWLGFLAYSRIPFLPTLNPQCIVVFLLSLYCLVTGLRALTGEESRAPEIGSGLRGITEGFLWFSVLSICLGWSLFIAGVFVVIFTKRAAVISGVVSLALVVPLLAYTAVSLHKKKETAPAMVVVVLLAAGLAGLLTFQYLPVFYYMTYSHGGPVMEIIRTNRYMVVVNHIPILIAYNVYHIACFVLAGVFLFRFKKGSPARNEP
jgi:hypothetical protein